MGCEAKTRAGVERVYRGPSRHYRLENLVKVIRNECGEIADDDVLTEDELEGGDIPGGHELSSLSCGG